MDTPWKPYITVLLWALGQAKHFIHSQDDLCSPFHSTWGENPHIWAYLSQHSFNLLDLCVWLCFHMAPLVYHMHLWILNYSPFLLSKLATQSLSMFSTISPLCSLPSIYTPYTSFLMHTASSCQDHPFQCYAHPGQPPLIPHVRIWWTQNMTETPLRWIREMGIGTNKG